MGAPISGWEHRLVDGSTDSICKIQVIARLNFVIMEALLKCF